MSRLVSQPQRRPTRKVAAGAAAGLPAGIAVTWLLESFFGISIPAEVAAAIGTILSFAAAYLTRERA